MFGRRALVLAVGRRAIDVAVGGALVGAIACGGAQTAPLAKAGADKDDGAGDLARASLSLRSGSGNDNEPEAFADNARRSARYDVGYPFGGGMYGGDPYGGFAYGGTGYANWTVPQWTYAPPNRMPRYNAVGNLSAAVEGTVTWLGAPPTKVTSACGAIDNPTLRVGPDKALRGVIVYIEKIVIGRGTPYYSRPTSVGGVLAKHGCTIMPAAQIVAPLPGSVTIHGDHERTKLRITADKAQPATHDLQEAGFVQVEAKPGITRVESDDGKLSAAWVLALDTPYYAITDDAGRYRIDELAPGTYEVTFWQPPIATPGPNGTWTYSAPIVARRSVKIGAKTTQLSVTLR